MSRCPHCDDSGFVVDEATNTARDCTCRRELIARRKTAALEARLPDRYKGVGFERFPVTEMPEHAVAPVRRYVRRIDEHLDGGRGIWFFGGVGTGKTTLAMLVSKSAMEAGRSVAIYSLPRLLNLLRRTIDSEEQMLDLLDRLASVDLLHLDDVGAERSSDWVLEQLYSVVNTRYEEQRALVVTTNLDPEALAEQVGERTVSRISEICGDPIPLFGDDHRRQYAATAP